MVLSALRLDQLLDHVVGEVSSTPHDMVAVENKTESLLPGDLRDRLVHLLVHRPVLHEQQFARRETADEKTRVRILDRRF